MKEKFADEFQREERRKAVAANLLSGLNFRDIARALDVSIATVQADAKLLLTRWKKESVNFTDDRVQLDLRRLDRAMNAIWEKVLAGDDKSIETMLKIMVREAALVGLDQPAKSEVDVNGLSEKPTKELIALLKRKGGKAPDP